MNEQSQADIINQATRPKGKSFYDVLLKIAFYQDSVIGLLKEDKTKEATELLTRLNEQIKNLVK